MKRLLLACAVAASAVYAEEAEETDNAAPAEAAAEADAAVKKAPQKIAFSTLPLCLQCEGSVEVCKPGGEWQDAEEGKYYPLGSSYRTGKNGTLVLSFGADSTASINANSEFGTRIQALGTASRTVVLVRGTLDLKLADNLPEGAFFVTAPGFTVKNPAGESKYVYEDMGDGDRATVRCVTGSLGIEGRHFEVLSMRSANEVIIRTSSDHLSTFLYGTSGDYVVRLDQGLRTRTDIGDDGQPKSVTEPGTTDWHLSPATKIVINRAVSSIGERMSVHTMAFDAAGERKSECYFCEGRAEINSGEMIKQEKSDAEEQAKRAAEATETTAATDAEDNADEAKSEGNNSSDNNEE